jgi:hypothetical protein
LFIILDAVHIYYVYYKRPRDTKLQLDEAEKTYSVKCQEIDNQHKPELDKVNSEINICMTEITRTGLPNGSVAQPSVPASDDPNRTNSPGS